MKLSDTGGGVFRYGRGTRHSILIYPHFCLDEGVHLRTLVSNKPRGPVATKLQWVHLTDEDFERLLFALISSEPTYENPEWLTKTNAPDRGRDLSVYRIHADPLGGTIRQRVIIQCKHWLSKSVGPTEVAVLREQMKLWEPPRVDVHVIATFGRFTAQLLRQRLLIAILDHCCSGGGIDLRCVELSMPEELLNLLERHAVFQQCGGDGVSIRPIPA